MLVKIFTKLRQKKYLQNLPETEIIENCQDLFFLYINAIYINKRKYTKKEGGENCQDPNYKK
jgi:hypothetical protein